MSSLVSVTSIVTITDEANSQTITSTTVQAAIATPSDDATTSAQAGPAASVPSGDEQTATDEGAAATTLPMFGAAGGVALVALGLL